MNRDARVQRGLVFALEVTYLLALMALAGAASAWGGWRSHVPTDIGPVPLSIPWFGALGGVITSLRGVFDHAHNWNSDYLLRHIARPLTAAVSGTVAYLILLGGLVAVGQTPATGGGAARAAIVYDVVAFLVGYREEVFRTMLQRVVDRLLRA